MRMGAWHQLPKKRARIGGVDRDTREKNGRSRAVLG
jgi:hypothetical protein